MAFGFIKKIFSFGDPQREEAPPAVPDEALAPAEQAQPAVDAVAPEAERVAQPAEPASEPVSSEPTRAEEIAVRVEPQPEPLPGPIEVPPVEAPASEILPESEPESEVQQEPKPEPTPEAEPVPDPVPLAVADLAAPMAPVTEAVPDVAPEPEPQPIAEKIASAPLPVPAPAIARPGGRVTVGKSVETVADMAPPAPAPARARWIDRLKSGLSRSSKELSENLSSVFVKHTLTEDFVEELEEVLIRADLGIDLAMRVTDALESGKYGRGTTEADVRRVMAAEIEKTLAPVALPLELDLSHRPHVILVVGVNGTGKTTTIGKLAAKLTAGGLSVTLAAGDTFRAAAIEQLKIWGDRTGSPVVATRLGADAAGLAYEAFEKAREAGSDVLIIDTAGRLQNKVELMAELDKIVRVLRKLDPQAPHTVLQTIDATTGQNALNQVEIFGNVAGVTGLVMTKLDGTARGGILVAIAGKHRLPVYFIGVGEQVDDLEPFSAGDFARAIAGVA